MTPLFKTHFSIGKSILTIDEKTDDGENEGPDNIIDIAKKSGLDTIYLVEDSLSGLRKSYISCETNKINLVFGWRFNCFNSLDSTKEEKINSLHKNIVFAKNTKGVSDLVRIYSAYSTRQVDIQGFDYKTLYSFLTENLILAVPFYDSYLYNNLLTEKISIPSIPDDTIHFLENNQHPFDIPLSDALSGKNIVYSKSIYYKDRSDFEAWQTFKCLSNRSGFRSISLERPEMDFCCSDEFCFESYLDAINEKS